MSDIDKLLKEINDLKKQVQELTERVDTLEDIVADVPDDVIYPWFSFFLIVLTILWRYTKIFNNNSYVH